MPAQAKYSMLIPTLDNLGNKLQPIAQYGHQYLFETIGTQGSYIEPGKQAMWRDQPPEPHEMLVTVADETPEMDSRFKQLASYIAEVCNQWGIFCMKEGKNGVSRWEISNPNYVPGGPAEEVALADPANALRSPAPGDPAPVGAPSAYGREEAPGD